MHWMLKRQAIKPVRGSGGTQQRNFDAFQWEYSVERPTSAWANRRRRRGTSRRLAPIPSDSRPSSIRGISL
jgi:hypothetical protein